MVEPRGYSHGSVTPVDESIPLVEPPPKRRRALTEAGSVFFDARNVAGEALRSAALVATASHGRPGDQILAVTPAPPWGAPGATGMSLTRRNFWELSVEPCDCSRSSAKLQVEQHLVQRPRLTDVVVNAVLELEEARCKQCGDQTTLILNSFFVESLGGTRGQPYSYERVRRWHSARKLQRRCGVSSILQLRRILVPVNIPYRSHKHNARLGRVQNPLEREQKPLKQEQKPKVKEQRDAMRQQEQRQEEDEEEDHWVLAEIQPTSCSIRIFDSADAGTLTQPSKDLLCALRQWVVDVSREQSLAGDSMTTPAGSNEEVVRSQVNGDRASVWTLERGDSPQRQDFTGDCGVYMLANAYMLARSDGNSSEESCPSPVTANVYSEADIPQWRTIFAAKLLGASAGHEAGR